VVKCTICGSEFEETESEKKLIQAKIGKPNGAVALHCGSCGLGFRHYLDPDAKPVGSPCPALHCTGHLCDISNTSSDEENKWGCGECGNVWLDDDHLQQAISNIVSRFPHRKRVYQQYKGRWFPVPPEFEPREYIKLVEGEPWQWPVETLLCSLMLKSAFESSPEVRQRVIELVERLRTTTVPAAELVDETRDDEQAEDTEPQVDQQRNYPTDAPLRTFGIRLKMPFSEPQQKNLEAAERFLDSVRESTADGEAEFGVEFNGESIGAISHGKLDDNIVIGLLQPWREDCARASRSEGGRDETDESPYK
jgi:hypothetical protein